MTHAFFKFLPPCPCLPSDLFIYFCQMVALKIQYLITEIFQILSFYAILSCLNILDKMWKSYYFLFDHDIYNIL